MKLSTSIIQRPRRAAVLSVVLAAIAVPASQARLGTNNSGAQAGRPDLRVYRLIDGHAESAGFVTDNSAARADTDTQSGSDNGRVYRLIHGQPHAATFVTDRPDR